MRKGICISMALGMLGHLSFSSGVQAAIIVEPTGSTVAGKTIAEWSAEWWKWAAPLAPPGDPFTDQTGAAANKNQAGPVFYLAGSENTSSRAFTLTSDKFVLLPLVAGEFPSLSWASAKQKRRSKPRQRAKWIKSTASMRLSMERLSHPPFYLGIGWYRPISHLWPSREIR